MRGGQVTQQDVAEIDFVHLVIVTPQAEPLTLKGLSDKATVIEPLDIAFGIDGSNLKFGIVFHWPNRVIFELRSQVDFGRSFHTQGFVRALLIKAPEPFCRPTSLSLEATCWGIGYLEL